MLPLYYLSIDELVRRAHDPSAGLQELTEICSVIADRALKGNYKARWALKELGGLFDAAEKRRISEEREQRRAEHQRHEQLRKDGFFKWPSTDAPASRHGFSGDIFWYQEGLLSYVGYKVGDNGLDGQIRRRILDCVFNNELPRVGSPEYIETWGLPKTPDRLRKMAESIAAFTRNSKRNPTGNYEAAISDWESDLDYLYHAYYVGKFKFSWPLSRLTQ